MNLSGKLGNIFIPTQRPKGLPLGGKNRSIMGRENMVLVCFLLIYEFFSHKYVWETYIYSDTGAERFASGGKIQLYLVQYRDMNLFGKLGNIIFLVIMKSTYSRNIVTPTQRPTGLPLGENIIIIKKVRVEIVKILKNFWFWFQFSFGKWKLVRRRQESLWGRDIFYLVRKHEGNILKISYRINIGK